MLVLLIIDHLVVLLHSWLLLLQVDILQVPAYDLVFLSSSYLRWNVHVDANLAITFCV